MKDCLDGNQELINLGAKYGITPDTDPSVIEKKIVAYVALHYLDVHKSVCSLNDLWQAGKYYNVGFDGAILGHKMLGALS